jgi:hypothetical protein
MKTSGIAIALLAASLVSGNAVLAQKVVSKPAVAAPAAPAPDLSKINPEKVLQELQTAKGATNGTDGQGVTPLEVIATFLQLSPGQISELEQLLETRQEALAPRAQQLQALSQQLEALLSSGGNPAQVGATVIQIHAFDQQIAEIQHTFLAQLAAILGADQLQRLQAVQIAAQLQPILPAFRLLFPF